MTFGEKLYALRRGAGYSQEDLAEKLAVTRQAVSRWESGAVLPDAPNLLQLGRLFDVSIDYLLKDELTDPHPAAPGLAVAPADGPAAPAPDTPDAPPAPGEPDKPDAPGEPAAPGEAPPPPDAPAMAGQAAPAPKSRRALRLWMLAFQALGFVLVLHSLWQQEDGAAFLFFVLFNLVSLLVFEIGSQLLPGTAEDRARCRLRFYRAAVWLFGWYPLSQGADLLWHLVPFPNTYLLQPLSKLALYFFLCGGISYAAHSDLPAGTP